MQQDEPPLRGAGAKSSMTRATFRALTSAVGLTTDALRAEYFGVSLRAVQRWAAGPEASRDPDGPSGLPLPLESRLLGLVAHFNERAAEAVDLATQGDGPRMVWQLEPEPDSTLPQHVHNALQGYLALRLKAEGLVVEVTYR